jgi:LmbE family N-acetylglucosaminyl deacetylase
MVERVLVLAPHTDDAEFGCGGTIARFIEEGRDVFQVAFSAAEASLPSECPRDLLRREIKEAAAALGLPENRLQVLSYPVREFPLHRQAILDDMIRLAREIRPDRLLLPSVQDTHQDHDTIAREGFRAFKHTTMFGYEVPWNNLTFTTQAFVFLDERHLAAKLAALACYRSQQDRAYASPEFIRGWAMTRGMQIGCRYAESFEVVRWVER